MQQLTSRRCGKRERQKMPWFRSGPRKTRCFIELRWVMQSPRSKKSSKKSDQSCGREVNFCIVYFRPIAFIFTLSSLLESAWVLHCLPRERGDTSDPRPMRRVQSLKPHRFEKLTGEQ
jgi:hypothetical protein